MSSDGNQALERWIETLWNQGGSDLLLIQGSPPRIRVEGQLRPLEGEEALSGEQINEIAQPLLSERTASIFAEQLDADFSFSWRDRARLRGSIFTERGEPSLALRIIPNKIPSFSELGLPPVAEDISQLPRGLVLVTGPTGSGKSTTLASIIDRINKTRSVHILTIEDPIEYLHDHRQSAVSQREIGVDTPSFERGLRSSLREDPDVLLIGEMRDIESIQIALTMAETGHLVFATLHTNDAPQAVDRIIDVFPAWRQEQTRFQLAASLAVIIAQRLIPKASGGMTAAFETLVATPPVRNLIRDNRVNQLRNVMLTSRSDGMWTLETNLAELIVVGTIAYDDAARVTAHPKELDRALEMATRREPHAS
jgi:twitching motility protein PilT